MHAPSTMDSWQVLTDPLRHYAASRPDHTFLLTHERSWTYAQLWADVERVAGGLAELGIGGRDHVALLLDNGPRFLITWFALARLGAVEVPINTAFTGDPLRYQLEQSDSVALVVEDHYMDRLTALVPLPPALTTVVGTGTSTSLKGVETADWDALRGTPPEVAVGPRDPAAVMYTSGTTGRSKGAVLSHRYFLRMAATNAANMRLTEDDVYYTCLPLFHGMAQLSGTAAPLLAGARLAVVPRFSVSRFWGDCRTFGATGFGAIAAMTTMLHQQEPSQHDRDHDVRFAFSVAVPPTIVESFEERFGVRLVDGYGITEGGQISYSPYDAPRLGSCGKPVPLYEVELHDEHGHPVSTGEPGEIVVRPREPGVSMDGYYGNPEATLEAFRHLWLHTGDIGRFDEDGYLYFVDRNKDVIRRRGENISSLEVEQAIAKHPAIAEVAAYPIPSSLGEDDVMVAVVVAEGFDPSWDELLEHCRAELPRFALPRYLRRLASMPRTPTEKTEKYRLRGEGVTGDTFEVPDQRWTTR